LKEGESCEDFHRWFEVLMKLLFSSKLSVKEKKRLLFSFDTSNGLIGTRKREAREVERVPLPA